MGKYKVIGLDGTVVWSGESWDHFKVFAANRQKILENGDYIVRNEETGVERKLIDYYKRNRRKARTYKCYLMQSAEETTEGVMYLTADEFIAVKKATDITNWQNVSEGVWSGSFNIFCPALEAGTLGDISEEEVETL